MSVPSPLLLVVDDDQVARELLAEALGREGYRVRVAAGGEECLQLVAAQPFDMALVDLRMPDLDGLSVLKRLATIQPDLPVVILTAFATIDSAREAFKLGAAQSEVDRFEFRAVERTRSVLDLALDFD